MTRRALILVIAGAIVLATLLSVPILSDAGISVIPTPTWTPTAPAPTPTNTPAPPTPTPSPIEIDIKPGSYPNSINLYSKGVVPVAVLTTAGFDASTVDPATVLFAGAAPLRWDWEDVDYDGDLDLDFHFKTQELNLDEVSTVATLTGQTFGSMSFEGTDTVNMIP